MTDTAIYTSAAATAKRLLSKFGAPAWLHHPDGGSGIYDPNTGTVTAATTAYPCTAAVLNYSAKDIDGTLVLAGDAKVLIAPDVGQAPEANDKIVTADRQMTVVRCSPVAPAGVVVLYEVQVR